jgi:hypothetical protein
MARAAVGALGAVAVLSAGGCGARNIDGHSAADQIGASLAARYGGPAPHVSCPAKVPAKLGQRFNCTTALDGQPLEVTVTVTTTSGDIRPALDAAVVVVADADKTLAAGVGRQLGELATVSCDSGHRLLVEVPGQSFTCTAHVGTTNRALHVKVTDTSGRVTYTLAPPVG